jgi:hypothetical protein
MAEFGTRAITDAGWATSRTFVYVDDVDAHCAGARAAGATIITEPDDRGPNRIYVPRTRVASSGSSLLPSPEALVRIGMTTALRRMPLTGFTLTRHRPCGPGRPAW